MRDRVGLDTNEALERVIEHGAGSSDGTGSGFADEVWRFEHGSNTFALGEAWSSIAHALQMLNSVALRPEDQLRIAYAIAEVVSTASRQALTAVAEDVRLECEFFLWRVACAWEAFLAGDIDDLIEHVRLEAAAADFREWP